MCCQPEIIQFLRLLCLSERTTQFICYTCPLYMYMYCVFGFRSISIIHAHLLRFSNKPIRIVRNLDVRLKSELQGTKGSLLVKWVKIVTTEEKQQWKYNQSCGSTMRHVVK